MENPRRIKLLGDRTEALRKFGKGQALMRATKLISEYMGFLYYRMFSSDRDQSAQTIAGYQDQITLKAEIPVPPEEVPQPLEVFTLAPCLVQYVYSEMKIFFLCEDEHYNFYLNLNDLQDSFEGLKCLTGLGGFNFTIGAFVYRRNATTQVLCRFRLGVYAGHPITYDGHEYKRRTWEILKTPLSLYPENPPLRTFPARSINSDYTISSVSTFADAHWLFFDGAAIPLHLALWLEHGDLYRVSLGLVKFQVICWISVQHSVNCIYVPNGNPTSGVFRYHFQNIYFDGTGWYQVPDPSEDNWELVVISNPYHYPWGIFGYSSPPVMMHSKDWYWGSNDRHEIYLATYCCAPAYRDNLRGIAGYLKIHTTHVADQAADPVTVHDRSETVFIQIGNPDASPPTPAKETIKKTYDRSYTRVEDETEFQLIWRRGATIGAYNYVPIIPWDAIHPNSGGIESRCGAQDRSCGVVLDVVGGSGGGWSYG